MFFLPKLLDRMMQRGSACAKFDADPSSSIRELHMELTYSCNCKCIMCDLWSKNINDPKLRNSEMTLEQIRSVIEESESLKNINCVVLSGGEPFIWPSIVELCAFLTDKFPSARINFLTNGINSRLVLDKLDQILRTRPVGSIQLGSSIDGIGETHDRIRGIPHAFEKLVGTIKEVKKRHPGISYGLNFTLTPRNYRDLVKCYDFAEEIGCDFCAQFVVQWDVEEEFVWEKAQFDEIRAMTRSISGRIIEKYKKKNGWYFFPENLDIGLLAQIYYWSHLTDYAEKPKRYFDRCTAGRTFVQINPYGDVYFCPLLKKRVIGNLKERGLDEIWMSPAAQRLRHFIDSKGCHCWLVCTVFPMAGEALTCAMNASPKRLALLERRMRDKYRKLTRRSSQ